MTLPPILTNRSLGKGIVETRQQLFDLQRQLSTGKKAETYGAVGTERTQLLSLRAERSQIAGYRETISMLKIRLSVMQQTLTHMRELASDARSDGLANGFELRAGGQTLYQVASRTRFGDMVEMLNTEIAGRRLFGGKKTDSDPVAPAKLILDGGGGKAGFSQVAQERRAADLGTNGLGRLTLTNGGSTITLAEDVAGSPFGFKLAAKQGGFTGATITGPTGSPPALSVQFGTPLPSDEETLTLTLALPDGSTKDITLTALTSRVPSAPGEFAVGPDAATTAANFETALTNFLTQEAKTTLAAASLMAAANDFFDTQPPKRVDGPPFDTATALKDADSADTIFWYQGDDSSTPARQTALAKVDDAILVAYGARADEEAFRTVLKQLAALSVETFTSESQEEQLRYEAIKDRARDGLAFPSGVQSLDAVVTELTMAEVTVDQAEKRHEATGNLLDSLVSEIEDADMYEVSAKILQLQTRLEASYQTTSVLARISLVNFL